MVTSHWIEGETGRRTWQLKDDGAAMVGTGLTVTLDLRDRNHSQAQLAGQVDWLVIADGTVYFDPATEDLKAARSPYRARFKVTDAGGRFVFYPSEDDDEWKVRP